MAGIDAAESQAPLINSLAIIFVALSTVSVILRLYTRKRVLNILGADDVTISIAQIFAIAVSVLTLLQAKWGLGRHTAAVAPDDAVKQLKSLYANTIIYNAAQTITKISFLILYRRIFPDKRTQATCFWLLMFIVAWGITQEFIVAFACTPLENFEPKMTGKCIYSLPVWYLTSSMNIVTDFLIFIIPIIPVLKLQMGVKKKALLLCLFCLGFFTCAVSLIRISTLNKGINTTDPFWDNSPAAYWSVIELNCGILCACLPTLRPLIQKIVPHLLSTYGYNSRTVSGSRRTTLGSQGPRSTVGERIYVQKDVELHSTTELSKSAGGCRGSYDDTASQEIEIMAQSSTGRI
ncbi:hypothetical protein K458DRAFT_462316 [Lentithecium fluviatile CBS 122367]|uniref:Rhodopsin domain-containing protein n=1 Tax=Lentithecium fluviatile CBS 122367 TaxID=1168545 RepID=A0A6G1JFN0_9PLEO|nr:hypothetical protein K458DRAFT_462316 [Lentithecium fluviatile CBS 122367]